MGFDAHDFIKDGFGRSFLVFLLFLVVDIFSGEVYIATSAGVVVTRQDGATAYWFIIFMYVFFMVSSLYSYFYYKKRKLELSNRKRGRS